MTTYEYSWFLKRSAELEGAYLLSKRVALNWDEGHQNPALASVNFRTALFQISRLCLDRDNYKYTSPSNTPTIEKAPYQNLTPVKERTKLPSFRLNNQERYIKVPLSERQMAQTYIDDEHLENTNAGSIFHGKLKAKDLVQN